MKPRRLIRTVGAALGALIVAGCSGEAPDRPSGSNGIGEPTNNGEVRVVATDLDTPWSVTFHESVPLVSERNSGRVSTLRPDGSKTEVATIDGVQARGEGGLLGIAAHDGFLYSYFTTNSDNRVTRAPITGDGMDLRLGESEVLLSDIPQARTHNGGRVAFGPDGLLYVSTGDANERTVAQDRQSLAGKILRMTPTGDVPADNPIPGSLVYSYGHRNVQGLAWTESGQMYASEFGANRWDELNLIRPGGNYGWPEVEGGGGGERFVDPVQQWPTSDASPSGMAIVGNQAFLANLRGESIRKVDLGDPAQESTLFADQYGRIRDVVVAPGNKLWAVTNNTDGRGDPEQGDDKILEFSP